MRTTILILGLLLFAAPAATQEEKKVPKQETPVKEAPEKAEAKPDPTARFWEARKVMLAGRSKDAAELFRTILKVHPGADVADDCLYWSGRCWLRVDDREPDAVVAFKRLIETMPKSPFVDDAARELRRLGDETLVPVLVKRLDGSAAEAELAARALAELGDARGVEWLAKKRGEKPAPKAKGEPKSVGNREASGKESADELEELRAEVKRLRKELDESVKLLEKLLAEREAEKQAAAPGSKSDEKTDPESETKK